MNQTQQEYVEPVMIANLRKIILGPYLCLKAQYKMLFRGNAADVPTLVKRLSICNSCELREGDICGSCGCYLPLKTSYSTESCPENKW